MVESIIVTTVIPIIIFIPITFILNKQNKLKNNLISISIVGGAAWAIVAAIILLPSFLLYDSYSIGSYMSAMENKKAMLFWFLILFALISEIIRYKAASLLDYFDNSIIIAIIFGLGWTISEIFTKYLFFFDETYNGLQIAIIYLYVLVINSGLSVLYIRSAENTKFVIFGVFMKLLLDLGLYGAFGYNVNAIQTISAIGEMVFVVTLLVFFSILAIKYRMED